MRRVLRTGAVLLAAGWLGQQLAADEPPASVAPPGAETPGIRALIDRAAAALEADGGAAEIAADPVYVPAREWTRFRQLLRAHARDARATLVPPQERGEPLIVTGTVRDAGSGDALGGALVYVYQTDARGWYSDRAPHVSGVGGDEAHARLFGYLRTAEDGRYELRTIRPLGYPRSSLPGHLHVEIQSSGASLVTEIRFADDPRMTPEMREQSLREGFLVCPVERDAGGVLHVVADLELQR
ncbi:MAG TPA: hypothetical protein VJS92_09955 [Candidatus Polarisedimenticolaceae bacterium]|nr:hypothetical protein [Candidatus Polarisedimenticolaceae bacterium]